MVGAVIARRPLDIFPLGTVGEQRQCSFFTKHQWKDGRRVVRSLPFGVLARRQIYTDHHRWDIRQEVTTFTTWISVTDAVMERFEPGDT